MIVLENLETVKVCAKFKGDLDTVTIIVCVPTTFPRFSHTGCCWTLTDQCNRVRVVYGAQRSEEAVAQTQDV